MRRIRLPFLLLAWLLALSHPSPGAAAETKRIFTVPPRQWDNAMSRDRAARLYGASDLGNLTGGIQFGLTPAEVNAKLPASTPGTEWSELPFANEYPEDVRYFWVRLDAMRELRDGITGCAGASSYIVFLFYNRVLFRISWRLLPDKDCPSPRAGAEELYARYLGIDQAVAVATHYIAGGADAVEITDPTKSFLLPYRWRNQRGR